MMQGDMSSSPYINLPKERSSFVETTAFSYCMGYLGKNEQKNFQG